MITFAGVFLWKRKPPAMVVFISIYFIKLIDITSTNESGMMMDGN